MTTEHAHEYLTTQEVADRLRVSRMTVVRWAESGALPVVELPAGKTKVRRRFRAIDVDAFVAPKAVAS